MNYSRLSKLDGVTSENVCQKFSWTTVAIGTVVSIVVGGIVVFSMYAADDLPGVDSPFKTSDNGGSSDWNNGPVTYASICSSLGASVCSGAPPASITVPTYFGGNIDYASAQSANNLGNIVVSVIGTDNEVGYYTSDPSTKSYPSILKRTYHSLYGNGGDGIRYILSSDNFTRTLDYNNGQQESYTNYGLKRMGVSGVLTGWQAYAGGGPGAAFASATTNNVLSVLFQGRGSEIHVYHGMDCYNSADQLFFVTLDGLPSTVRVNGRNPVGCPSSSPPNGTKGFWKSSLVYRTNDQVHTVNVSTGGSNNGQLSGVRFKNPTGAVFDNYARAVHYVGTSNNAMIYEWTGSNWYWGTSTGTSFDSNSASVWSGGKSDVLLYAVSPYDAQYAPDLFNQISGNIVLPRRALTNNLVDIVIVFPPMDVFAANLYNIPKGNNQLGSFTTSDLNAWQAFVTQMTTWATQYNIATLDLGKHYRTYTASGFTNTGNAIQNMINLGLIGNKASLGSAGTDFPLYSDAGHAEVAKLLFPLMHRKLTPNV